jgi:hypothetical protein
MSGTDPLKKLFPKSKYCNSTQFFKSLMIGPCKRLNPKESISNDWSWHTESIGTIPLKFWCESSIFVTKLSELQVIPVKPHGLEEDSHELKTSMVEP